jgi:hypothetical protein
MYNPRIAALISTLAVIVIGSTIPFMSNGVGPVLLALEWTFLAMAIIGLVGSLAQLRRK